MQYICNKCGGAELTQMAACNINTDEVMNYKDEQPWCEDCEEYVEEEKIDMPEMTTAGYVSRIIRAEQILDCVTDEENTNPAFLYSLVKKYNKMYNR